MLVVEVHPLNSLRPRQHGRHFTDDIFKCIFLNENIWISIKISLKFVPKGSINNISALVQIMAWCRPGDKPLFEPMMVSLLTHICVTQPQWVKHLVQKRPKHNIQFNVIFFIYSRPISWLLMICQAMVLTMKYSLLLEFNKEGFQLPMQCGWTV